MQIYGLAQVHGPQPINAPHTNRAAAPSTSVGNSTPVDELNLSSAAQFAERTRALPEMRMERVEQLRAAIASGQYETEEKLNVALDRMLDEIG